MITTGILTANKRLFYYGLLLLTATAAISFLSHSFVFGQVRAARPIIPFLILELSSFLAYFLAVLCVLKKEAKTPHVFYWILGVALLARLFYFSSELIQETDPYRYIWDGQAVIQGANPYEHSPREAFQAKASPYDGSQQADFIYERVNHPGIRTIYPPASQVFFALSQWIAPWGFTSLKILVLLTECLILFLLTRILSALALSPEQLLIYAWSPLILKEYSNSLHIDVLAVLFLCGMVLAVIHERWLWSFIALSLSVLAKLFAIVLFPILFVHVFTHNRKAAIVGSLVFFAVASISCIPFLSAGTGVFDGINRFATGWRVNDGLFGVFYALVSSLFRGHETGLITRALCGLIFTGILGLLCVWVWRMKNLEVFLKTSLIALSSVFFLSPAASPWYFTWVIPFLVVWPVRPLLVFSGLVFLYYLDFYFSYRSEREKFLWVRWIEYLPFYLLLGAKLWTRSQQLLLLSLSRTKVI